MGRKDGGVCVCPPVVHHHVLSLLHTETAVSFLKVSPLAVPLPPCTCSTSVLSVNFTMLQLHQSVVYQQNPGA